MLSLIEEVRMIKLQVLIIIAGLFQISSMGLDQYVIQQEQGIRNLENLIKQQKNMMEENVNGNITYGKVYSIITRDAFLKLQIENNILNDQLIKKYLMRDKKIIYDHFQIMSSNPYIKIENPDEYLKYFEQIEILLNSDDDVESLKNDLLHNFRYTGFILNYFYEQNEKLEISIKKLETKLRDTTKLKFTILVFGMMCNIISIFFILMFFLNIYRKQ